MGSNKGIIQGDGEGVRLLHLGESTVAGVGIKHINDGLTVNVANDLNIASGMKIQWQLHGENGIKLKQLLHTLKAHPPQPCDITLLTMGVNDTAKFTSVSSWKRQITQIIELLSPITQGPVIFTQVPSMMQFPALPAPLSYFLGLRSSILDLALRQKCKQYKHVYYAASKANVKKEFMAEDGYHPSELGYSEWAKSIAPGILKNYKNSLN